MRSQREAETCLRSQAGKGRAEVRIHVYLLAELLPALPVQSHLSVPQMRPSERPVGRQSLPRHFYFRHNMSCCLSVSQGTAAWKGMTTSARKS